MRGGEGADVGREADYVGGVDAKREDGCRSRANDNIAKTGGEARAGEVCLFEVKLSLQSKGGGGGGGGGGGAGLDADAEAEVEVMLKCGEARPLALRWGGGGGGRRGWMSPPWVRVLGVIRNAGVLSGCACERGRLRVYGSQAPSCFACR